MEAVKTRGVGLLAVGLLLWAGCGQVARNAPHSDEPCSKCHGDDKPKGGKIDHHAEGFPSDCERCHGDKDDWGNVTFDHSSFPLTGRHLEIACSACHEGKPSPLPTTCIGCHEEDRQRAKAPNHLAPGYPTDCAKCHTTKSWSIDGLVCSACHGDEANGNAAPPKGVGGETTTGATAVGAHQAHLKGGDWHADVACEDCHQVPKTNSEAGHTDSELPAELIFSKKASAFGAQPKWDGKTCSGTYCHGATLTGGKQTAPSWTVVDGTQTRCDSCHGMPPTAKHQPTDTQCDACHGQVVRAGNTISAPALHIDGQVQVDSVHPPGFDKGATHGPEFYKDVAACQKCHGSSLEGGGASGCAKAGCHGQGWKTDCTFCHGGADNTTGAPPLALDGASATSAATVGAHTAHVTAGSIHGALDCTTCHDKPTDVLSPGHVGFSPADVKFTGLSAGTSYSGGACSNSYCHGATLSGGKQTTPSWTTVDGTQKQCDSCHGMPPTNKHQPTDTQCSSCHDQVVDASNTIIAPALHIDGKVQASGGHPTGYGQATVHAPDFYADPNSCKSCHGNDLTGGSATSCAKAGCHGQGWKTDCTFCHGGTDNTTGAPPESVGGATATTDQRVGAHTEHLTASARHAAYACDTCHAVPASALSAGHVGTGRAELSFGGLAAGTSYSSGTGQCSNTYCHGNGNTAGSVTWTGSVSGCGACHTGNPNSGEHKKHREEGLDCATCHACVVNGSKQIIDASRHVDGNKDVCGPQVGWNAGARSCSPSGGGCHGTESW